MPFAKEFAKENKKSMEKEVTHVDANTQDHASPCIRIAMKTDGNGRKNLISTSVSIFFGENEIGFGKYGYGNGIVLRGSTEMNQYGC